jgi:cytidylate kinase
MGKKIITISRTYGSGGRQVAKALASELGIHYYDKELINMASMKHGVNVSLLKQVDEKPEPVRFRRYADTELASPSSRGYLSKDNLYRMTRSVIEDIAAKDESAVILGRCAHHILKDHKDVIRVVIYADQDTMIKNAMHYDQISEEEAKRRIARINKEREAYNKCYTSTDWFDARQYDICLNTSKLSIKQCTRVIQDYMNILDD